MRIFQLQAPQELFLQASISTEANGVEKHLNGQSCHSYPRSHWSGRLPVGDRVTGTGWLGWQGWLGSCFMPQLLLCLQVFYSFLSSEVFLWSWLKLIEADKSQLGSQAVSGSTPFSTLLQAWKISAWRRAQIADKICDAWPSEKCQARGQGRRLTSSETLRAFWGASFFKETLISTAKSDAFCNFYSSPLDGPERSFHIQSSSVLFGLHVDNLWGPSRTHVDRCEALTPRSILFFVRHRDFWATVCTSTYFNW